VNSSSILRNIMTKNQFLKVKIWFTACVTLILAMVLGYQYVIGGIPSHHFLAREDMPEVSNVWGILTIPAITWFLLWRIEKRIFKNESAIEFPKDVVVAFVLSLGFGIALGVGIQSGFKLFTENVPAILLILALLFPTYRAEYFLGFVLGLTYHVGGVLPIVVGTVFLSISAVVHLYVRAFFISIFKMVFGTRAS
jgi:hypothetical protein